MLAPVFEYDPAKSAANKAKHGIDFDEAQALWLDEKRIELPTRQGADTERRWLVIGAFAGRVWTAVATERNGRVRIISARRSRVDEVRGYADQQRG
jgi:uncharacterized protein